MGNFHLDHLYETQTDWWSASGPNSRNPYPAPFNQPFFIIMNLAIGGNFGGDPTDATIFPGEIQVDYVRVYQTTRSHKATCKDKGR